MQFENMHVLLLFTLDARFPSVTRLFVYLPHCPNNKTNWTKGVNHLSWSKYAQTPPLVGLCNVATVFIGDQWECSPSKSINITKLQLNLIYIHQQLCQFTIMNDL